MKNIMSNCFFRITFTRHGYLTIFAFKNYIDDGKIMFQSQFLTQISIFRPVFDFENWKFQKIGILRSVDFDVQIHGLTKFLSRRFSSKIDRSRNFRNRIAEN